MRSCSSGVRPETIFDDHTQARKLGLDPHMSATLRYQVYPLHTGERSEAAVVSGSEANRVGAGADAAAHTTSRRR
jgi:hypothetical protein